MKVYSRPATGVGSVNVTEPAAPKFVNVWKLCAAVSAAGLLVWFEIAPKPVTPVPPLATLSVPASTTSPVVAVDGVKPVDPADHDVT